MLAVASADIEAAQRAVTEFHDRGLSPEEKAAANVVLDFDAENMTCPACMTTFATGPDHCPDCGLFLGG